MASQPADKNNRAAMQAWWQKDTTRTQAIWAADDAKFNQTIVPKVQIVVEELRANGLSDEKLDQWMEHPRYAGMALNDIVSKISKMAIKMEEIENGKK